jgi:Ca2+-binding EF-hand superfamily protein
MKSKLLIIALTSLTGLALAADNENKKPKGDVDPAKRAEQIIKTSDKDGNGTLSKDEFAQSKMGKTTTEKRGAEAFDKFFSNIDKNSDGELDKTELSNMKGSGKKPDGKKKEEAK